MEKDLCSNSDSMFESTEDLNSILWIVVALLASLPLIVFLIAYVRVKSERLLITAIAFCLFVIKAVILAMKLVLQDYNDDTWWMVAALLDMMIIGLIAYALSKKA